MTDEGHAHLAVVQTPVIDQHQRPLALTCGCFGAALENRKAVPSAQMNVTHAPSTISMKFVCDGLQCATARSLQGSRAGSCSRLRLSTSAGRARGSTGALRT